MLNIIKSKSFIVAALIIGVVNFVNIKATENTIPEKMKPNTIITYDQNLSKNIKTNPDTDNHQENNNECTEIPDIKGRLAEDQFVEKFNNEAKNLPVYEVETILPKPEPGMTVIYGTDGYINHIIKADGTEAELETTEKNTSNATNNLSGGLYPKLGHRADPEIYKYKPNNQISEYISITSTAYKNGNNPDDGMTVQIYS